MITEFMKRWLRKLRRRYRRRLGKIRSANRFEKIAEAVRAVEGANRPFEWRAVEYSCLIANVLSVVFLGRLTNHSIGPYQYKVSMILDSIGVEYRLKEKQLTVKHRSGYLVLDILRKRNDPRVLLQYINSYYPHILSPRPLEWECLYEFARDYSRNTEFTDLVNYLSVLLFIMSDAEDWSLLRAYPNC